MSFSKVVLIKIRFITIITSCVLLSGCTAIGSSKFAALQVTTNPQASVFLGDTHLGKTPFFSDQLREGVYTIKVSASQAKYVDKIELKNGSLTVVNRDLNDNILAQSGEVLWLDEGKNEVFIATNPPAADVTIDGQFKGKSPLLITDLQSGDHTVLVTQDGYGDRKFAIKSSNDYKLLANVTLSTTAVKNPPGSPNTSQVASVEVLKTPQGFLRVRKEPELTAQEIGQVESGTTFEVIQETDTWVKINFEGKLGWISKQFTKSL